MIKITCIPVYQILIVLIVVAILISKIFDYIEYQELRDADLYKKAVKEEDRLHKKAIEIGKREKINRA